MMVEKKEVGMDLLMVASKEGKMVDSDDSMGGLKVVPMGFSMAAKWVACLAADSAVQKDFV